ncbi:hypothetical protein Droror1_Dr00011565 [Drosera rotundifolia]
MRLLLGLFGFASTEGINEIKNGNLISLSEQEVLDCDTNGNDQGCNGGMPDGAFQASSLTMEASPPKMPILTPGLKAGAIVNPPNPPPLSLDIKTYRRRGILATSSS